MTLVQVLLPRLQRYAMQDEAAIGPHGPSARAGPWPWSAPVSSPQSVRASGRFRRCPRSSPLRKKEPASNQRSRCAIDGSCRHRRWQLPSNVELHLTPSLAAGRCGDVFGRRQMVHEANDALRSHRARMVRLVEVDVPPDQEPVRFFDPSAQVATSADNRHLVHQSQRGSRGVGGVTP